MAPGRVAIDRTEELKKFFKLVFEATSAKTWIYVKDLPLASFREQAGLDHNWGTALSNVLKDTFLVFEGERAGMHYKRKDTYTFPDYSHLATLAILEKRQLTEAKLAEPKSDLKPHKPYERKEKKEKISTITIKKRTHLNVDDACYCMHDNLIKEFEIVGVRKVNENEYLHTLMNKEIMLNDVPNIECFCSVDSLVDYLTKRVQGLN